MKRSLTSAIICVVTGLMLQTCIRDEVLAPPTLSPLAKTKWISGEVLTVTGTNFDPVSTKVFIDEAEVSTAGAVTNTTLNIIVPTVSVNKEVSMFVSTKYGTSSSIAFTIQTPLPTITRLIPDKAGVGMKIKIAGSSFENVTSVKFKSGTNPAVDAAFQKIAADTLQATVPANAGFDACDITLGTENGSSQPSGFTILHPPKIGSFTPTTGGVVGGIVQINGEYLSPLTAVKIGSQKLEVISGTSSVIVARIVAGVKSDTIQVSTSGGESKATTRFNMASSPVITAIDKPTAVAGTEVKITGQFFTGAFDVRFGDITTDIISNNGTEIRVKVPEGISTGKISVTTAAGTGISSFDFVPASKPIVSDFSPATGGVGTRITINGLNFGASDIAGRAVTIGALGLTGITWSDTKIEGTIPAGAATGKITVKNINGTFETTSTFTIAGSSQVTGFSPSTGIVGTTVTITGVNMGTTPDVRFNNIKATSFTKTTPTEIICLVPAGATTGKISVNNALSTNNFTVTYAPVIQTVSPARGPVNADVVITGEYLSGSTIRFANNLVATKVGADTDTQVKVKVPAGAISGKITATNAVGTGTSASNFEVLSAPTITSFTPTAGIIGTQVTINGTNLQYNPVVRFGSIMATVRSVNATGLIVDVPVGATDGKISVTTDGTLTAVVSAANFDVIGSPVINSLSPATGATGAVVAINGADFGDLQSISFDGIVINSFISKTLTKIEFAVPTLTAANYTHSINVSVKTSVGTSANATFTYIGPPSVDAPWPASNPVTWATLITGSGLTNVTKITINGVNAIIDYKADNAITTRVPGTSSVGPGSIKLYYTNDNFVAKDFTVLSAPPPGVFPPPQIVIPPPPPGGFVPVAVNADWPNAYLPEHYFRIDATSGFIPGENGQPIGYNSSGRFKIVEHYYGFDPALEGLLEGNESTGNWSGGRVYFKMRGQDFVGQYNQNFQLVFTDQKTGRQLVLGTPCPNFPNCK